MKAIKILSAALSKFQTADLHYHHGNLLKDVKRYDDAKQVNQIRLLVIIIFVDNKNDWIFLQSFMNAVKIDPTHSSAHMNLGVILHMKVGLPFALISLFTYFFPFLLFPSYSLCKSLFLFLLSYSHFLLLVWFALFFIFLLFISLFSFLQVILVFY